MLKAFDIANWKETLSARGTKNALAGVLFAFFFSRRISHNGIDRKKDAWKNMQKKLRAKAEKVERAGC